jgi:hypothetical protein
MANTLNLGNGNWATKEDSLLAYNSENGNFKPLPFDFTRASSATVVNKAGLIETVGSGEPRIDFSNDVNGALLLEPTRTNLITKSEDIEGFSQKTNVTITNNQTTSPNGNINASNVIPINVNGIHEFQNALISFISGVDYTVSAFVKANGYDYFSIKFASTLGVFSDDLAWFNVSNGTIGTISPNIDGTSIEDYGNGWYKITATQQANATGNGKIFLGISNADNTPIFLGNGSSGIYVWGYQLEQGSYATSYIPTQGSAVTRVADASSQTPPSGIIGQTEGTMFFEIDFANTSGVAGAWSISSGSSANRITMNTLGFSLTQFTLSIAQNYNSSSTKLASTNVTYSDNHKVAIKYSATTLKLFVDGQLADSVATDGFGNYTKFYLGGNQVGVGGDARKFIQADLYNTALTDQELQALTT